MTEFFFNFLFEGLLQLCCVAWQTAGEQPILQQYWHNAWASTCTTQVHDSS